jgi:tRNA wybutosine-synthesizing protein 3
MRPSYPQIIQNQWLQPDRIDEDDQQMSGFAELRQRTLTNLYGDEDALKIDKSPKGSVDKHIQNLVNLINSHPSYVTLSSCSGRIAVFDPSSASNDDEYVDETISNDRSGKGGKGQWLFVSHDEAPEDSLLSIFSCSSLSSSDENTEKDDPEKKSMEIPSNDSNNVSGSLCWFRFEPLLLHVAAASIRRGQQLVEIGLSLGLRESGMLVSSGGRITVALRTHSLTLVVPLYRSKQRNSSSSSPVDHPKIYHHHHPFQPTSPEYTQALMREANQRLRTNLQKLQKLESVICEQLFRSRPIYYHCLSPNSNDFNEIKSYRVIHKIPDLHVHSHATVVLRSNKNPMIMALGGYNGVSRSQTVYAIPAAISKSKQIHNFDEITRSWHPVDTYVRNHPGTFEPKQQIPIHGTQAHLTVQAAPWTARQGLAAISWNAESMALIFGGRKAPNEPCSSEDLLIFSWMGGDKLDDTEISIEGCFYRPMDVRGTLPSPRWGHSFIKLPTVQQHEKVGQENLCLRVILMGGRDEHGTCVDSLYTLSLWVNNHDYNRNCYFLWEPVLLTDNLKAHSCSLKNATSLCRRFHHASVALDSEYIFVFGGLFNSSNVLEAFDREERNEEMAAFLLKLQYSECGHHASIISISSAEGKELYLETRWTSRFGHAACLLSSPLESIAEESSLCHNHGHSWSVLVSGGFPIKRMDAIDMESAGLSITEHNDSTLRTFQILKPSPDSTSIRMFSMPLTMDVDLGCLIHHGCVVLQVENGDDDRLIKSPITRIALIGGGVTGFAFPPCWANSYELLLQFTFQNDKGRDTPTERKDIDMQQPMHPHEKSGPTVVPSSSDIETTSSQPHVLFVLSHNAKFVKNTLEEKLWLDRRYRMTKAVADHDNNNTDDGFFNRFDSKTLSDMIAVPVTETAVRHYVCTEWGKQWVLGHGRQACPLSTRQFASRSGGKRLAEASK